MSEELKACPWCGSTEHLSLSKCGSLTADMPSRPYRVVCNHIDHDQVQGPVAYGRLEAITAWNTRAFESRVSEFTDALEEARPIIAAMPISEMVGRIVGEDKVRSYEEARGIFIRSLANIDAALNPQEKG